MYKRQVEFLLNGLFGFETCKLVIEVFRQPEIIRFDTPLDIVDASRISLEAQHRVVDLVVVNLLACREPAVCRLVPGQQCFLACLGILELGLEAGDIFIELGQAFVDGQVVLLERIDGCRDP